MNVTLYIYSENSNTRVAMPKTALTNASVINVATLRIFVRTENATATIRLLRLQLNLCTKIQIIAIVSGPSETLMNVPAVILQTARVVARAKTLKWKKIRGKLRANVQSVTRRRLSLWTTRRLNANWTSCGS